MIAELFQVVLEVFVYILRSLSSDIQSTITNFEAHHDWTKLAATIPLVVLFGVCAAVMPGHNKAILAAYAVDADITIQRACKTALNLAIYQVGMAILLSFTFTSLVIVTTAGGAKVPTLQLASRLILLVIGLWLLARAAWQTGQRRNPRYDDKHANISAAAGLVPCPFTLIMVIYAAGLGVPEAGIVLALTMLVGIVVVNCSIAATVASFRALILVRLSDSSVPWESGSLWAQWLSALLLVTIVSLELWN